METFTKKVYEIVRNIPIGKTMSYKEVAIKADNPKAYRAVGNILNKNYNEDIPCHRVIRTDGKTGGYNRGSEIKKIKLIKESKILIKHN